MNTGIEKNLKLLYEEKFKLINEAYETLSDNNKRIDYDRSIPDENNLLEEQLLALHSENQILRDQITQLQFALQKQASYTNNLNNYYAQHLNQNNSYVNYNDQQTNNNYKKNSNMPFHNLFKTLFSLILPFMFFYFMLKIIFAFSYLKNSP